MRHPAFLAVEKASSAIREGLMSSNLLPYKAYS